MEKHDAHSPPKNVFVGGLGVNQEAEIDLNDFDTQMFYDDRKGQMLDVALVKMAEKEEIDSMRKLGVGHESTEDECWNMTAPPRQGSDEEPDVRARLCG